MSSPFGLFWKVPHLFLASLSGIYAKGSQRPGQRGRPEKGDSGQKVTPYCVALLGPGQESKFVSIPLLPTSLPRS